MMKKFKNYHDETINEKQLDDFVEDFKNPLVHGKERIKNSLKGPIENKGIRVFVYGTLMKGRSNHQAHLANARLIGEGIATGYKMYDLGHYPGIKHSEADCIKGELYEVNQETLDRLDELEGEGSLYIRENTF